MNTVSPVRSPRPILPSTELELARRENEQLRRELEQSKRKVAELEARAKFMDEEVWNLRRLVKRVAREGYLQIAEVEKERGRLEAEHESLRLVHSCLQTNAATIEQCIAYWRDVVNEDAESPTA